MDTWALDYFDNILIPMDNFVTRSPERFVSCKDPDYLYQAYYICKKCLEEKGAHMTEMEKLPAPKLMEIILTSCRGRVDQWVEPFILLALQHVEACETNLFKDLLMKVVAGAFYYNAPLAVAGLQKAGPGALGKFFQLWFAMLWRKSKRTDKNLHFKRDHDKKLCILGLSTLLAVPPQSLPPELRDAGKQLMEANLKLLFDLKQLRDNAEDSSSEEESEEGSDYEEEDDDEPGAESHKMYGGVGAIESIFGLRGGGDETESDSEDEWTDDEEFSSPIDGTDAFVTFADSFLHMQATDPARLGAISGSLAADQQLTLRQLMEYAEERRKSMAEELAKAQQGAPPQA